MSQTISIDGLKLGSKLAADVMESHPDGSQVLLFAAGQEICTGRQLQRLRDAGVKTVPVRPESMRASLVDQVEGDPQDLDTLVQLRTGVDANREMQAKAQTVQLELHHQASTSLQLDVKCLDEHYSHDMDLVRENPELAEILALLREDSPTLYRHSHDVAVRALRVLYQMNAGADSEELRRVYLAGLLHDIGLSHANENRPIDQGALNEDGELFQLHAEFGDQILQSVPGIPGLVRRMVAEHHELLSGQGFPHGLVGDEIHPLSLLLGLCDKHDRLIQASGYRAGLSPIVALNLMRGWADRDFPREQVDAFLTCYGPFPIGAPVLLENGLAGRVTSHVHDRVQPLVMVREEKRYRLLDSSRQGLRIQKGISPQAIDLHPAEIF